MILVLPYSSGSLLHTPTREALGLDLEGAIVRAVAYLVTPLVVLLMDYLQVVIDEAHNVASAVTGVHSGSISQSGAEVSLVQLLVHASG